MPLRARAGTMSLMLACDAAVQQRWQPLLQDLSSRLFRIGARPGDGARTKLVNNLLAAINLAGAAEALALAWRIGLALAALNLVLIAVTVPATGAGSTATRPAAIRVTAGSPTRSSFVSSVTRSLRIAQTASA